METETFPVGEWQHVAMSIDVAKNSVKLFRNGFLVSSESFGGTTIPVTESPVHYGARGEGSYKFKGGIDDFRIYERALSEEEMLRLYQLERPSHPCDSLNGIAIWLDATNIDGKQNTTLTNGSNVSEWKDLSDYELNFTASGSIYKKNDGNDYVELNDQADILVSERNSSFSGKEFSIQMFAVVELDQDYNQQFGTILGQFGNSSDAASATKSLSFGIGYPQGTAGETSMYTDSWTPVGSKTDSNVQKNQTMVVSYGIDRWYDHESRTSFELNGDNLTSATY